MSPTIKDYFVASWQVLTGYRIKFEQYGADIREGDIIAYIDSTKPLNVLDLANGLLCPQYTLLRAEGHHVVGIDLVNRRGSSWIDKGYRLARWFYAWHVGTRKNMTRGDNLICGDVSRLPFRDGYFDLVTSNAAFEHFLDVPFVVSEMHRVMRSGGVAWICIHLFTSPSGGHNLSSTEIPLRRLPKGVDAWDHLRQRHLPLQVPLNRWRVPQYLETFSQFFEVIKNYCLVREGENLLTPEIEAELVDHSREELTCMMYIIVARKPMI